MKKALLDPLLETFANEKQGEEADVSAANVVAWWLLHGPYWMTPTRHTNYV